MIRTCLLDPFGSFWSNTLRPTPGWLFNEIIRDVGDLSRRWCVEVDLNKFKVWQVIQRGYLVYFIHELLCFWHNDIPKLHWNFTQFNCLHGVPACPSCPRSGTTQRTSVRQGLGIFSGDTWVVYGCVSHVLNRFCTPRFLPLHKSFPGDAWRFRFQDTPDVAEYLMQCVCSDQLNIQLKGVRVLGKRLSRRSRPRRDHQRAVRLKLLWNLWTCSSSPRVSFYGVSGVDWCGMWDTVSGMMCIV